MIDPKRAIAAECDQLTTALQRASHSLAKIETLSGFLPDGTLPAQEEFQASFKNGAQMMAWWSLAAAVLKALLVDRPASEKKAGS